MSRERRWAGDDPPDSILHHHWSCGRKVPLSTYSIAELYLEWKAERGVGQRPYLCPEGGPTHWHVGRPPSVPVGAGGDNHARRQTRLANRRWAWDQALLWDQPLFSSDAWGEWSSWEPTTLLWCRPCRWWFSAAGGTRAVAALHRGPVSFHRRDLGRGRPVHTDPTTGEVLAPLRGGRRDVHEQWRLARDAAWERGAAGPPRPDEGAEQEAPGG